MSPARTRTRTPPPAAAGHDRRPGKGRQETDVPIRGAMIRLGQLLKLAGVVDSGAEAKVLLAGEAVVVNGEPEQRRGRQLGDGDSVGVRDRVLRVRVGDG